MGEIKTGEVCDNFSLQGFIRFGRTGNVYINLARFLHGPCGELVVISQQIHTLTDQINCSGFLLKLVPDRGYGGEVQCERND